MSDEEEHCTVAREVSAAEAAHQRTNRSLERFGSGKGSEVVIYRPGGRNFRLGHHKRNDYVRATIIKDILSRVGVSFGEWLDALS